MADPETSSNDNVPSKRMSSTKAPPQQSFVRSLLQVPAPIRYLFSQVPLQTYPANQLPLRAKRQLGLDIGPRDILYIFTTEDDAKTGRPSYNPGCLKWQTILKFRAIPFSTRPSSNHASQTGALPFLLPLSSSTNPSTPQSPSCYLHQGSSALSKDIRHSLLSHPIRLSYLLALYLDPKTFTKVAAPLYVWPCSSNSLVRASIAQGLRDAAEHEVLKGRGVASMDVRHLDAEALVLEAEDAWAALAGSLGSARWFEDGSSVEDDASEGRDHSATGVQRSGKPGLLDAAVFAYSHVIMSCSEDVARWATADPQSWIGRIRAAISKYPNLVEHRDRILREYF